MTMLFIVSYWAMIISESSFIDEIYRSSIVARSVLSRHVHETPLVTNYTLNNIVGKEVYLKLENMQKTGAFKVRGAFYKISRLVGSGRVKGVVAGSGLNVTFNYF